MENKYLDILNYNFSNEFAIELGKKYSINNFAFFEFDLTLSTICWASDDFYVIFGIEKSLSLISKDVIMKLVLDKDRKKLVAEFSELIKNNEKIDTTFQIVRYSDSQERLIHLRVEIKKDENGKPINIYGFLKDITENDNLLNQSFLSDILFQNLYFKSPFGISLVDSFTGKIYHVNQKYQDLISVDFNINKNIDWMSFTHPDDIQKDLDNMEKLNNKEINGFSMEKRYIRSNGSIVWVNMTIISIIIEDERIGRHLCVVEDITEKKENSIKIKYALEHDKLTGLYNREFIDVEFSRLKENKVFPISIILGNINGMKLYNENYGNHQGDKEIIRIGKKIKEFMNSENIIARVSGDEFAIILSGYDESGLRELINNLTDYVNNRDQYLENKALSISFGFGLQKSKDVNIDELYNDAQTFLYRKKYYNSKSSRSTAVNLIMNTLFEKNEREKDHSQRVGEIAVKIAGLMNLESDVINTIRVAGYLHDIGKIGIDESILNKQGKLNDIEWEEIKLHTIKGARILERSQEYFDIYNIVLSHHEKYDGSGYPNGLSGENIPLEARIIAIADSYDAMTKERTYKATLTHKEALYEIESCAGTQFDPQIVTVLLENGKEDEL